MCCNSLLRLSSVSRASLVLLAAANLARSYSATIHQRVVHFSVLAREKVWLLMFQTFFFFFFSLLFVWFKSTLLAQRGLASNRWTDARTEGEKGFWCFLWRHGAIKKECRRGLFCMCSMSLVQRRVNAGRAGSDFKSGEKELGSLTLKFQWMRRRLAANTKSHEGETITS